MPALLNAARLVLRFTKLSNDRHCLTFVRADGSSERVELETRSFLTHDLLHLAAESEARLARGVFGTLAAGTSYAALTERDMRERPTEATRDLHDVERVVGPLTGYVQGKIAAGDFLPGLTAAFAASGDTLPPWLTEAFIAGAAARYRSLMGQWRATPFGATMEVVFEPK